jgi:uncharacterized protein YceK
MKRLFYFMALTFFFYGCSTMNSINSESPYNVASRHKVYAGSQNDLRGLSCLISDEFAWGFIAIGELPFCFVADTLLLPYTIYVDYFGEDKTCNKAVSADD